MSVFGLTSPAVSATSLVFNLIATPSGVYRYWREKRIIWPLCLVVVAGTTPGVIVGGFVRVSYLPDPVRFKAFLGLVLLGIGSRLVLDIWKSLWNATPPAQANDWNARILKFNSRHLVFEFQQQKYHCKPISVLILSLVVGFIGGIYGIGGAAIIAPFLVALYGLPVHTIAGATLMGTLVTSVIGVSFYQLIQPWYQASGLAVAPNWGLGLSFGIGGMVGMYLGVRTQRFMPALLLKAMLVLIIIGIAVPYLLGYLRP